MGKYEQHFLMSLEDVKEYTKCILKFFGDDEKIEAVEIGDGNINYVFKIYSLERDKSIIIKQADKCIRTSKRALDINRNKIEAKILKLQKKLSNEHIPKIYYYDEKMYALCMEDISNYKNIRKELLVGKTFDNFCEEITTFLVNTLLPTTDLVLDRALKKTYLKQFINIELCDITEDLVFTEPYYNYKNRNIIIDENIKFVEDNLYNNDILKCEVAKLRDKFMNLSQALIHGDLHSGSIFINETGIKVIDPEFAFYGPIGYDVGNVIGNLFFSYANNLYTINDKNFIIWIEKTIQNTVDLFIQKFSKKYDELVEFPLYKGRFKDEYIKNVLSDSFGYAGTEIIRRVVGDSKVLEVEAISDINVKVPFERALIRFGIYLIINREKIKNGRQLMTMFKTLC